MNVHLMYRDRDFDPELRPPLNEKALVQDLELETLFEAMSGGDRFLHGIAKTALLSGLGDVDSILYRQEILADSLKNPTLMREIYAIAVESIETKRKGWFSVYNSYPSSILYSAVKMLEMYLPLLDRLRKLARERKAVFKSEGFTCFFAMLERELDDEYFEVLRGNLRQLDSREGFLISARLGEGNEGFGYMLRKPNVKKNLFGLLLGPRTKTYSFSIHPKDEAGSKTLGELKTRGINLAANALAQAADHIDGFFRLLQIETAFYVACINLQEKLALIGESFCWPSPSPHGAGICSCKALYDICLSLFNGKKSVGNDLSADGKDLVVITGVNQGGKSTFLRSVGLAQLLFQCGMFVPAEYFSADICQGIFTHHHRKEDRNMKSGKFDEELSRMSLVAEQIRPYSLILFNESFAATNEREGSEIARQIVTALIEKGIKVFFVTHLYTFARAFQENAKDRVLLLRAERQQDGVRTFKIIEGPPSQRSYGEELYYKIFPGD